MILSFHRMATVVTVALALLLGGCGSSDTKDEVDLKPTAEEMATKAIKEAKDALTAAQTKVRGCHDGCGHADCVPSEVFAAADDLRYGARWPTTARRLMSRQRPTRATAP